MEELSPKLWWCLQCFYQGLIIDVRVVPSDNSCDWYPSQVEGMKINGGEVNLLKQENLLNERLVKCNGNGYRRFTLSSLGKEVFERGYYATSN